MSYLELPATPEVVAVVPSPVEPEAGASHGLESSRVDATKFASLLIVDYNCSPWNSSH